MTTRPLARFACLGLIVGVASTACDAPSSQDTTSSDVDVTSAAEGWFRPVAEWTGTLALPAEGERKDGAVRFVVGHAPDARLVGKTLWLSLADSSERRAVTRDVTFSASARESVAKGSRSPARDWKGTRSPSTASR